MTILGISPEPQIQITAIYKQIIDNFEKYYYRHQFKEDTEIR
jgi:hypothetical protein